MRISDWSSDGCSADLAADCGPIALVKDGDTISIDAEAGTIELEVDADELARRKAEWRPRQTDYQTGALWRYAQNVGPAWKGAVTHPGAQAEPHGYAALWGPPPAGSPGFASGARCGRAQK